MKTRKSCTLGRCIWQLLSCVRSLCVLATASLEALECQLQLVTLLRQREAPTGTFASQRGELPGHRRCARGHGGFGGDSKRTQVLEWCPFRSKKSFVTFVGAGHGYLDLSNADQMFFSEKFFEFECRNVVMGCLFCSDLHVHKCSCTSVRHSK